MTRWLSQLRPVVVALVVAGVSTPAMAARASRRVQSGGAAWSMISPVAGATWIVERSPGGRERLELLVLWRGSPGWFLAGGGSSHVVNESSAGLSRYRITQGSTTLAVDHDASSRVAIVAGQKVGTARHNVVFVDDVDAPTGPRVAGTMSIERLMPGSAAQIGLVLRKSPAIMRFLRCDATVVDPAKRLVLERLCLETIGAIK